MADWSWKLLGVLFSVLVLTNAAAAMEEDDEEFFYAVTRAPAEYSLTQSYDGARDEQPLEIQPVLPQPSRFPQGTSQTFYETGGGARYD